MNQVRDNKGQTILEVVVALTTAVIVLSAITAAVITALSNAEFQKNQGLATQYSQQAIEVIRNIRNTDYATFSALIDGTYCLGKDSTTLDRAPQAGCSQNLDGFIRKVVIEKSAAGCEPSSPPIPTPTPVNNGTRIDVYVSWSDGKCTDQQNEFCHEEHLVSCLGDFTVVSTP